MTNTGTDERPILVGVDGSASALAAVRWAAREAARRHKPLRLLHVCFLMPVEQPKQMAPPAPYEVAIHEQGEHWLNEAARTARTAAPNISVTGDLRDGFSADVLVRESASAHLLVLGSRGVGGFRGLLVGSVSVALSAHAHCPVVVLHGPADDAASESGPIVVGVDGSPLSDAAVEFAFTAAAERGVPLIAVHSWVDVNMAGAWAALPFTIDWDLVGAQEARRLDEVLAAWQEKYPDVEVRKVVERDRPERALLKAATGAQLVVVGSRGRGALTGIGLGSVSQTLLHHAECPVVVARVETR